MAPGVTAAVVSRWTVAVVGAVIALGLARAALGRLLHRPGSRAAVLVSVGAGWLGAWVLWSFAGSLATRAGLLASYDDSLFSVIVLGGSAARRPATRIDGYTSVPDTL